jgi:arsenate reductase
MADRIYYLSTCDTCLRILKDTGADQLQCARQDIKTEPLTAKQVDALAKRAGSYEALISKRATLWKERALGSKQLTEKDYRALLLEHYTFLKRPVFDVNGQLFIGNEKKTVEALKRVLKLK